MTNKTEHHFDLNPKIDVEGDEIRFRVLFIIKQLAILIQAASIYAANPVNFVFPAEGEWKMVVGDCRV